MIRFLLIRLIRALVTLFICVTAVFLLLRVSGDPAAILLPPETPPAVRAEISRSWGLDRPLIEQFGLYLKAISQGSLGYSFTDNRPAVDVVVESLPKTFLLGSFALTFALLLGLPLGIVAALRHNTSIDRGVMALAVFGYSVPIFFLAILLILLFALSLRILPSAGSATWAHLVMPVLTLGLPLAGRIARFTRTSALEVLGKPFIRTARAKGVRRLGVILWHAAPNAAVPLLMYLGIEIGAILAGAAVTETVFAWPGLGRLLVESVAVRDLPVVQAAILVSTFIMVVSNLTFDIFHAVLDPRVGAREWSAS